MSNEKPTYQELEKLIDELKSEKKLQQNETRFSMLLKASEDMITIHEPSGKYLYYNGPKCYAITYKDIVGKMPHDLFDEDVSNRLLNTFKKVTETGESETVELLFDWMGEKKWFSEYIYPIKDEDGKVVELVKICKDIHKRKIAEQEVKIQNKKLLERENELEEIGKKIRKKNELLHSIFDSPKGVIIFSLDLNYCYTAFTVSHKETMKLIWGEEIEIGMNMLEAIHSPDDRKNASRNFDKALNGEHFIIDEEYGDEDLNRSFWENRYSPMYDDNNAIIGLTVFVTDITQRKSIQKELDQQNEKLYKLNNALNEAQKLAHVGSWSFTPSNQKSEWTDEMFNIWGFDEKKGTPEFDSIIERIHSDDLDLFNRCLIEAISLGTTFDIEFRVCIPNMQQKVVKSICRPILGIDNEVISLTGTTQDITERKIAAQEIENQNKALLKSEQELKDSNEEYHALNEKLNESNIRLNTAKNQIEESEANLRTLINTIPDLIWQKSVDGKFIFVNARIEALLGLKEQDIIGKTDYDFVDKPLADLFRENDKKAMSRRMPTINEEILVFENDKHTELLEITKVPVLSENNTIIGILGIGRNITEQRKAEQELIIAKEKAERNEKKLQISNEALSIAKDNIEESEIKFKAIFNNSVDAIGVSKNGLGVFFNPAYLKLFGYEDAEELRGKIITNQIANRERDRVLKYVKDRKAGKPAPNSYESVGLRKSGEEFEMELAVSNYQFTDETDTLVIIRDITKRKSTQKELEFQTEKLSSLNNDLNEAQATAKIGSWEFDLQTSELTWSREHYRIFELEDTIPAEKLREAYLSKIHPDDIPEFDRVVGLAVEKGLRFEYDHRVLFEDGRTKYVLGIGQPVTDADGTIVGIRGTAQDITQRKLTQKELEHKTEKLYELNNTLNQAQKLSNVGSWRFDISTQEIEWSDETFRIWELDQKKEAPDFNTMVNLIHPEDREFFLNSVEKAITLGEPYDLEHRICLPNGRQKSIRAICQPVLGDNDEVIYLGGVSQDITQRKSTQKELERQAEKLYELNNALNQAQKLSHVGSWQWDMTTDKAEWSDEMYNIYGVTRDTFYPSNENVSKTVLPEDLSNLEQAIGLFLTQETFVPFEIRIKRPSGEIRNLRIIALEQNFHQVVFGVTQDITEEKKTEAKLINANKELEVFFYRTSHDLRAPLARIMGLLQIIAPSQSLDEIKSYIELIQLSTFKLNSSLNDLIEIIQIRKGQLEKSEIDIEDVVDEIFETHNAKKDYVIDLRKSFESKIIYTDLIYLKIILRNLISNAIKFSTEYRESYILVETSRTDNIIQIKVEDNGIGIRDEAKAHLFEMFYRGGNESSEGTGLGLFIVQDAINKLGGKIYLESEKNKGSTFYVELPLG